MFPVTAEAAFCDSRDVVSEAARCISIIEDSGSLVPYQICVCLCEVDGAGAASADGCAIRSKAGLARTVACAERDHLPAGLQDGASLRGRAVPTRTSRGVRATDRPVCPAVSGNARFAGCCANNVAVTAYLATIRETDG
jgi:hypothetical protein